MVKTVRKKRSRAVIDVLMLLLMPLLMAYSLLSEADHEIVGIVMFILFIAHHVANRGWYKSLFCGSYSASRSVQAAVDVLMLAAMLLLMVSCVPISKNIFARMNTGESELGRLVHLSASHWAFVLMGLHTGFHWSKVLAAARKMFKLHSESKARTAALRVAAALVCAYGAYFFIQKGMAGYMLLINDFYYVNFDEPLLLFFIGSLTTLALFGCIGYYTLKLLSRRTAKAEAQTKAPATPESMENAK